MWEFHIPSIRSGRGIVDEDKQQPTINKLTMPIWLGGWGGGELVVFEVAAGAGAE